MAQAIRRKNIAAVQRRRREKKVSRFIQKAFNALCGIIFLVGMIAAPFLAEAILSTGGEPAAAYTTTP